MDSQTMINLALTGGGCLLGFILKGISSSLKSLQETDSKLCEKVQQIQVQIAGGYVTKEQLARDMGGVSEQLRRIEDKLDNAPSGHWHQSDDHNSHS